MFHVRPPKTQFNGVHCHGWTWKRHPLPVPCTPPLPLAVDGVHEGVADPRGGGTGRESDGGGGPLLEAVGVARRQHHQPAGRGPPGTSYPFSEEPASVGGHPGPNIHPPQPMEGKPDASPHTRPLEQLMSHDTEYPQRTTTNSDGCLRLPPRIASVAPSPKTREPASGITGRHGRPRSKGEPMRNSGHRRTM